MCSPSNNNFLEAINITMAEIKHEKVNMSRLGHMICVISSSDSFPYYNSELAKFTRDNLYERGIPCSYIMFSNKATVNKYLDNKYLFASDLEIKAEIKELENNTGFLKLQIMK